jgi:hypothetical protein
MMRNSSLGLAVLIAIGPVSQIEAQSRSPFVAGAASAGVLGVMGQPTTSALVGGYGYAGFERLIVGLQGGSTVGVRGASKVAFGMATLGYPAHSIRRSVVYPFIGVGAGLLRANREPGDRGAVFGAGVGADRMVGPGASGLLVGVRGGYVYRRSDTEDRAIYFMLAVGAGGRRAPPEKQPPIVAIRASDVTDRSPP